MRICFEIALLYWQDPMYSLLGGLLALLIVALFALGLHKPYEP